MRCNSTETSRLVCFPCVACQMYNETKDIPTPPVYTAQMMRDNTQQMSYNAQPDTLQPGRTPPSYNYYSNPNVQYK